MINLESGSVCASPLVSFMTCVIGQQRQSPNFYDKMAQFFSKTSKMAATIPELAGGKSPGKRAKRAARKKGAPIKGIGGSKSGPKKKLGRGASKITNNASKSFSPSL